MKRIPDVLKEGLLTPVIRTVIHPTRLTTESSQSPPILLKVVEYILNNRQKPLLEPTQSLHKGFTEKTS